LDPREVTRIPG